MPSISPGAGNDPMGTQVIAAPGDPTQLALRDRARRHPYRPFRGFLQRPGSQVEVERAHREQDRVLLFARLAVLPPPHRFPPPLIQLAGQVQVTLLRGEGLYLLPNVPARQEAGVRREL
jgi:hypothetical protein